MTMLVDLEIAEEVAQGNLCIEPLDWRDLQAVSLDLLLGNNFYVFTEPWYRRWLRSVLRRPRHVSLHARPEMQHVFVHDGFAFPLPPHGFAIAETKVTMDIPATLCLLVEEKTSLARLGVAIQNAPILQPGWCGRVVLELSNQTDNVIDLYPSVDYVCQVVVERLARCPEHPYGSRPSHYQGQAGATPNMAWLPRDRPPTPHYVDGEGHLEIPFSQLAEQFAPTLAVSGQTSVNKSPHRRARRYQPKE
jgi:dCTP deaminase